MSSSMRKLLGIVILVVIGLFAFSFFKDSKEEKKANDYETIETVRSAVSKAATLKNMSGYGNQAQWYVFDLRLIYQDSNKFLDAIRAELGEDFNNKLSTGDYIFVGILPYKQSYKIYAGDPKDENNMVYPEWKSTKIPKK